MTSSPVMSPAIQTGVMEPMKVSINLFHSTFGRNAMQCKTYCTFSKCIALIS